MRAGGSDARQNRFDGLHEGGLVSVESIFAPHVDLDVRALNGGRRPRFTGPMLKVTMFFVGEGEAILVRQGNRAILVDGGSGSNTNSNHAGGGKLFRNFPEVRIDAIIASHPHRDHTNFYPYLVSHASQFLRTDAAYYDNGTSSAENHWKTVERAAEGHASLHRIPVTGTASLDRPWHGTLFRAAKGADPKYWSVFLLLTYGKARFLFTGDAAKSYEETLLPRIESVADRIEVLKITHHGSSSGTSPHLVGRLRPSIAVASSDRDPDHRLEDDVRERLHAARVFSTYETWREDGRAEPPRRGDLVLRTDGKRRKIRGVAGILFEVERRG